MAVPPRVAQADAPEQAAYYREAIERLLAGEARSKAEIQNLKRELCRRYPMPRVPSDADILARCDAAEREALIPVLRTTATRSLSGVAVVTVQTNPWTCPHGTCIFCPGGPEWGTAQSYTGKEPAARRALRHDFDARAQAAARLEALHATGHPVDKVEVIVQGGTFPARPRSYQDEFLGGVFDALNAWDHPGYEAREDLGERHAVNETEAAARCVGLTIETKPDWARPHQVDRCLDLGATRLELGVQTVHDDQLLDTNRGHTFQDTLEATRVVKDSGLKLGFHLMPGLPGSTRARDLETFRRVLTDPALRPDLLKIYPTLVIPGTELARRAEAGEFEAVTEDYCVDLLAEVKATLVPPWVRIQRIDRDIPTHEIQAGVTHTNLREMVHDRLEADGTRCRCIRCREAGHRRRNGVEADPDAVELLRATYESAGGVERFLSFEDPDADVLVAYLRLREPSSEATDPPSRHPPAYAEHLEGAAVVRELRAVGVEVPLREHRDDAWQHRGYGRRLLAEAEEIARDQGFARVLVTSGVGVRAYYRRLGYERAGPYMAKELASDA